MLTKSLPALDVTLDVILVVVLTWTFPKAGTRTVKPRISSPKSIHTESISCSILN